MSRPALVRSFLAALSLAAAAAAQQPPAPGPALIRLDIQPAALRLLLADLPLDVAAVTPEAGIEVIADAADLRALDARGVPWTLRTPDLSASYAARLLQGDALAQQPPAELGAGLSPPFGAGAMGGYYTFDQVVGVLDQLRAQYPAIVGVKQAIGTSIEGRTLWAVKVSDNPGVDEAEPETRFDALHHAREPAGMQATLWFLLFLAENYGSDPLATYLVNSRETWFVPVVNPDGYAWNQSTNPAGGGLWRKNRRNNGDGSFGVDPNRNYPFQWGFDDEGSSPFTGSEIYRGAGPASEPEIAAMAAFLAARDFRTALSIHTYSDLWLLPYGYAEVDPDNLSQYLEVGAECVEDNGYVLGSVPDLLYLANGGTIDTEEGLHGTLSMSPEIGGPEDGFWPPTDRIVPLAEENLRGLQSIALAAGAWVRVLDVELIDEGDGDGSFEPGETVGLLVSLRNSGVSATAGAVTASLSASGAGASVLDGAHDFGVVASFASADNAAA
ncbi:MAG: zinc carboxypeptidase, partial [Planctomycetes bacterium]|nr:zinc carboxypeptidase [Planctomycetota bacterium]